MFVDSRLELCNATALNTGAPNTYLIGSQIDTGSAGLDFGAVPIYLVVRCTTDVTVTTTTGTLAIKLASDSTASISTTTSTVHLVSATLLGTAVDAGTTIFVGKLPAGTYEQFLGILQVTGTEALTAGAIDAFLTTDVNLTKAYPDGL